MRVHIAALRRKLEPDPANPRYIVTEPWVGYRFIAEPLDYQAVVSPRAASPLETFSRA